MDAPEITVGSNRPRLLDRAEGPPAPATPAPDPFAQDAPAAPYWDADKAAKVLAEAGRALSRLYGPNVRLSSTELELVGQPAANVANDWIRLPAGQQGDKIANLLALLAVVALLVLFRLPEILEAHDMLPRWAWARRGNRPAAAVGEELANRGAAPVPAPAPPASHSSIQVDVDQVPAASNGSGRVDFSKFQATTVGGGRIKES